MLLVCLKVFLQTNLERTMMASTDQLMDLDCWVSDSNRALNISIIPNTAGAGAGSSSSKGKKVAQTASNTFHPLFSYTVFGDEEKIFG